MSDDYMQIDSLSIASDFSELNKVEQLIDRICNKLQVNEDYYGNVLIAVTEAVNNAILHGNKLDKTLQVDLLVSDKGSDFCFSIKDFGSGFDYDNLPDPTSPDNLDKEHGRGVFLMKSLAESVDFADNGSKVNVYFTKK